MKHEQFIKEVRDIVAGYVADPAVRDRLMAAKLVYGIGDGTYRGICYHGAWKNGEPKPTDMVEVAASGEESPVQLAGTTIHELGHVVAGTGAGHSKVWLRACEMLGLRKIQAAGTIYKLANFAPEIRAKIAAISQLTDGTPVFGASRGFIGLPPMRLRPCPLGVGTRGGKSHGVGSGSRLRKFICECEKPVIARVAAEEFKATCDLCGKSFKRAPEKQKKAPSSESGRLQLVGVAA